MLPQIRAFLTVLDEGSLHRAAQRLHMSQSALSRQMQALEHELGGRILERTSSGVSPTQGGQALAEKMRLLLKTYDDTLLSVRQIVRGESEQLRIGYLGSAAREYLEPAMRRLRQSHPETTLKLHDLSPGEQIDALRAGKIDLGLSDASGELLARDFYARKLAVIPSYVALSSCSPLARKKSIRLAELKKETFIRSSEQEVPGSNRRLIQHCRTYGKFKPKFIGEARNISDGLSLVTNEGAVAVLPGFMHHLVVPGVTILPLADAGATSDLYVVWQRGRTGGALLAMIDALFAAIPPASRPPTASAKRKK